MLESLFLTLSHLVGMYSSMVQVHVTFRVSFVGLRADANVASWPIIPLEAALNRCASLFSAPTRPLNVKTFLSSSVNAVSVVSNYLTELIAKVLPIEDRKSVV